MIQRRDGLSIFPIVALLLLALFIIVLFVVLTSPPKPVSAETYSGLLSSDQMIIFIAVLCVVVFAMTFVNTDLALFMLIFSMLLSPELKIAQVPSRAVVVRIDDILLFVVFFAWFARMAVYKELGLLKQTPLNPLMLFYVAVCILASGIGIMRGEVNFLRSFFFILKYTEYFMLYFLVTNNLRDKGQIARFVTAFLVTGFIICIYATSQIGTLARTSAPFEGPEPEPNTLGGYLLLLFAVSMGLFIYSRSLRWRIATAALAGLITVPFVFTLSRTSYLAFIPMYLTLLIFSKKGKVLLIVILLFILAVAPLVMPRVASVVTERLEKTFASGTVYGPLGRDIALEQSAASRVESYKRVFGQWVKRPLLGYGVTGVGLVDAQYPRVLGETGIIGLGIFLLLMLLIYRNALNSFVSVEDGWPKGLCLGFLAGFIGLLFQSFGANTFIIVRIMEPFWFLTAIVMMLPEVTSPAAEAV